MNRQIAPASIAPPAANYAHAVISEHSARWLHTSGVVPIQPDGTVPATIEAQAEVVWINLLAILREAGMEAHDDRPRRCPIAARCNRISPWP